MINDYIAFLKCALPADPLVKEAMLQSWSPEDY